MVPRTRAYRDARSLNGAASKSLRRCSLARCAANESLQRRPLAQWRCEQELTDLRRCPLARCAANRGCWGRLKAHLRRIPHPCPPLLQNKDICATVWSSIGLAAHSFVAQGHGCAAATSRLRDASLRGPAGKCAIGVANRSRCVATVTPGCAGLAVPLATLPHWQSRLYAQAGDFPTSATAPRITGPQSLPPYFGGRLGCATERLRVQTFTPGFAGACPPSAIMWRGLMDSTQSRPTS